MGRINKEQKREDAFIRKKSAILTICAALAAGSLYRCAPEDGTSASTVAPANIEAQAESEKEETTAAASNTEVNEELKGDLIFAIWNNNLMDYIDQNDVAGKFQETYPNVNIEVEKIRDDSEYWNAMKMCASASQPPGVMFNKPFTLSCFKDYLIDLSGLDVTKNNELAVGYALDGKILGIPMTTGYEHVYYWKDMFEEAGVEVSITWDQLKEISGTLQDYYGKDNPDFMAIALGVEDEWLDYPFTESMPALEGGNGQNWNDMAKTDVPLAADTDIAKAYQKAYDLFTPGVFGKDPLGLGSDQATTLFARKQTVITALGDWGLQNIQNGTDDYSQPGTFYLPARNTENGPFRIIVQGDSFMGTATHSKNPEVAKAFVEWFYSDAWYPRYINFVASASSMTNFPKEKDPVLAETDAAQPDTELVMYDGGGDDFQAIQNETAFDYKKLGAGTLTKSFDLTARLDELNTKWAAVRQKLGIR